MESLTFFSVIRKSLFAIAIAVITVPASAHSLSNVDPLEKSADIKYLGSEDQALVFNVTYNNASASRFFVTIKDENGVTFFQAAYTDSKFNKKFILPGTDARKVFFIISDKKNRYTESFEISTETRVVEDVVVKRIN
ncbi:hypothetical protein [Agriterribacter humi]|jgi:hypothetical protein|uniref:hypothetical protein n=1 Tax=Agriterribacter humi TaxID=1104781 RepID=UPI001265A74B|nr:hypothetical protein [Agriterribacter humi]